MSTAVQLHEIKVPLIPSHWEERAAIAWAEAKENFRNGRCEDARVEAAGILFEEMIRDDELVGQVWDICEGFVGEVAE